MVSKSNGKERKFAEVTAPIAERIQMVRTVDIDHSTGTMTIEIGDAPSPAHDVQPSEYAHCLLMWLGSSSAVEWDEAA